MMTASSDCGLRPWGRLTRVTSAQRGQHAVDVLLAAGDLSGELLAVRGVPLKLVP
jgi:hypothetical protein